MGLRKKVREAIPVRIPEADIVVVETQEWGLALPGGAVMWGIWGGVPFDNAMDRLHMVARLQKTADEVGFGRDEFLARYNWVTRTKVSAEAYEEGLSYSINAPEVSQKEEES